MDTIETLKSKLAQAEQTEPTDAKYPTGIIIDTKGPQGNVFYLFGVANGLVRQLALSVEEKAEFERERDAQTTYQGHLDLMRKWFGIIFVGDSEQKQ